MLTSPSDRRFYPIIVAPVLRKRQAPRPRPRVSVTDRASDSSHRCYILNRASYSVVMLDDELVGRWLTTDKLLLAHRRRVLVVLIREGHLRRSASGWVRSDAPEGLPTT